jgi:glycine/D-amino acid oxidase-like deaminating enzyme
VHPHAVWLDTLDRADRAALEPGVPEGLSRTPDVLVVGGGLVGLATAFACHDAGLGRVVVLERNRLGAGASGGAAALLSPALHEWTDPAPFVALGHASLARWRELDARWDGALRVRRLDGLVPLTDPLPPSARSVPGLEVLDAAGVQAVEPSLAPCACGVLFTDQGQLHPLHAAAEHARRLGPANVATGVEMLDVRVESGRVEAIETTAGTFTAGAVVFATGNAPAVARVPQRFVKGHLLATAPAPFRLQVVIDAPDGLVLQLPDGRLVSGGTLDEGDESPEPDPHVIDAIAARLHALLPASRTVEVTHGWCCFRPKAADTQPVIDRVADTENAWVTCGHYRTGILMAPATGEVLARWIGTGERPEDVTAFGIARFSD